MIRTFLTLALSAGMPIAGAASLTVYQDPNCGCCHGWAQHMRDAGHQVSIIQTSQVWQAKQKLGVPEQLSSCHTAVVKETGQIIEGHVPARAVSKLLQNPATRGVAAPGMPSNAPGMGELDGNLVTVDFDGKPFSRD